MDKLVGRLWQHVWLMMAVVGGTLAIALPGYSGSVPSGLGSGVSVGGSTVLSIGASSLGSEEELTSTTPNATIDATTGEILLTVAAQQAVNQSATEILQGLQGTNPTLAAALTTPGEIALDGLTSVDLGGGVEEDAEQTVDELAVVVAAAIANGDSVSLTGEQGTLSIAAPTPIAGSTPTALLATSAVFVPIGGTPMVAPLRGTQAQIANAAGFLAAAFAAGLAPSQVAIFTEMALTGADYRALVALFNATGGLLPPTAAAVSATQLESAIQAYNQILDSSSPETLVALGQNSDFVALGRSLQQLRTAIDS
ncbi:hypothetical protein [Nodosilinea sp. E11]|uniref:hypothetical protein n=1 Tax=Nodosilinea sp. E11 TaxID=3037479 RepID=UPI002934B13C|nr:hypothetical protein [Nodosilinea sp. E11]WOD41098.1 hypothetical protein RRF56_09860 [Nodosilinea sp. E11]